MFSAVVDFVFGSFLNVHTWVGVVLGAMLSPLWVKLWNGIKAFIIKEDPSAAPVVADVTNAVNTVVSDVTPVVTDVVNKVDGK